MIKSYITDITGTCGEMGATALAPNTCEQQRGEVLEDQRTSNMLLMIASLLWYAIHAVHLDKVDVNAKCGSPDDCHKMQLEIASGGKLVHSLSLRQMSELRLTHETCHYFGVDHGNDFASFSRCGETITGEFKEPDSSLYRLEWDGDTSSYQLTEMTPQAIGDRGLGSEELHSICGVEDQAMVMDEADPTDRSLRLMDAIIEVIVFMDNELLYKFGYRGRPGTDVESKAIKFVADILNDVDVIYQKQLGIRVHFSGIRFQYSTGFDHTAAHLWPYLDEIVKFYQSLTSVKTSKSDGRIHGAADAFIALTGANLPESDQNRKAGVANVGHMCKPAAAVVIKGSNFDGEVGKLAEKWWFVHNIVHELGHSLGLRHTNCTDNPNPTVHCIMEPAMLPNMSGWTLVFSKKSKERVEVLLANETLSCLFREDLMRERDPQSTISTSSVVPFMRAIVGLASGFMLTASIILMIRFIVDPPEFALHFNRPE